VSETRHAVLPYLAMAALALIWGMSFFFIKVAVHDISPTALVLIRSAAGFLALAVIMAVMRRPLAGADWRGLVVPYLVMAIGSGLLPWAAIAWGEERITSGLASILNATTPLWTAVLVFWVVPSERPGVINYAGVLVGLAGVVILVIPKLTAGGLGGDALGTGAVLVAAFSYAVVAVYQRRRMRSVDVYEMTLGQLAMTVLITVPFAAPTIPTIHLDWHSMAAALFLGAAGSGVAYLLYYYILNSVGAVRGSGVVLLVPMTAVFWGVVLLHEVVSPPMIAGMLVILAGIVLTNVRRGTPAPQPAAEKQAATV
jgi:drug/metabolite transporter (DMT)-like permease